MTMRFEQILSDGIAQCSYLLGDDGPGVAAVVDPRPDVDIYLEIARRYGLQITHVFETHIHADFMSGARELVDRLGGRAQLCVSAEGGAEYGFDRDPVRDGDTFTFGKLRMIARHTPGHTPEHLAFMLHEEDAKAPWAVLTGDSFFVDSVGRPDLLGDERTEELTDKLFRTLHEIYMKLPDGTIIYPCHAAGSECGPDIGDRMSSTVGYERAHNRYLRIEDPTAFQAALRRDAPPVPSHYPRLKKVNAAGPEVLRGLPRLPGLRPKAFARAMESDVQLLDARDIFGFGAGHIPGALNIALRFELSVWAGWLLDPERPILLVTDSDAQVDETLALLWRTGFTRFAGYLAGGMAAWAEAGQEIAHLGHVPVQRLRESGLRLLDVRKDEEWNEGHIPGATHVFLGGLKEALGDPEEMDGIGRDTPVATYCASGYRASIAASVLLRHGFTRVFTVPGSWLAWQAADLPISRS